MKRAQSEIIPPETHNFGRCFHTLATKQDEYICCVDLLIVLCLDQTRTDTEEEGRVSANWDESSSQVSRQIGPLKPLKANGGRNTAQGVCVCAPCVCLSACVIPSGNPPWTQQRGGEQVCMGRRGINPSGELVAVPWNGRDEVTPREFQGLEPERSRAGRKDGRREGGVGRHRHGQSVQRGSQSRDGDGELQSAQDNAAGSQTRAGKDHREVTHEGWATPGTPAPAADSDCSRGAHAATAGKPPIKCYLGQHALKPTTLTFSCGWACISHYSGKNCR